MKKLLILICLIGFLQVGKACWCYPILGFYEGICEETTEVYVVLDSLKQRRYVDTVQHIDPLTNDTLQLSQITLFRDDIGYFRVLEEIKNLDSLSSGDVLEVLGNNSSECIGNFNFEVGDTVILSLHYSKLRGYYVMPECRQAQMRIIGGIEPNSGNTVDDIKAFILGRTTSSTEPSASASIFPNPSNGVFHITSNQLISSIEIISPQGTKIHKQEVNTTRCRIGLTSPCGAYTVKINLGDSTIIQPLIISR